MIPSNQGPIRVIPPNRGFHAIPNRQRPVRVKKKKMGGGSGFTTPFKPGKIQENPYVLGKTTRVQSQSVDNIIRRALWFAF